MLSWRRSCCWPGVARSSGRTVAFAGSSLANGSVFRRQPSRHRRAGPPPSGRGESRQGFSLSVKPQRGYRMEWSPLVLLALGLAYTVYKLWARPSSSRSSTTRRASYSASSSRPSSRARNLPGTIPAARIAESRCPDGCEWETTVRIMGRQSQRCRSCGATRIHP